jgi:uncharacterized pyridoxal phosphate-containing UPF0001 family protein
MIDLPDHFIGTLQSYIYFIISSFFSLFSVCEQKQKNIRAINRIKNEQKKNETICFSHRIGHHDHKHVLDNIIIDSIIQSVEQLVEEEIVLVEFDFDYLLLLLIYHWCLA